MNNTWKILNWGDKARTTGINQMQKVGTKYIKNCLPAAGPVDNFNFSSATSGTLLTLCLSSLQKLFWKSVNFPICAPLSESVTITFRRKEFCNNFVVPEQPNMWFIIIKHTVDSPASLGGVIWQNIHEKTADRAKTSSPPKLLNHSKDCPWSPAQFSYTGGLSFHRDLKLHPEAQSVVPTGKFSCCHEAQTNPPLRKASTRSCAS